MSIIVWDGRHVAADSLVTRINDLRSLKPEKKLFVRNKMVFGCIGVANLMAPMFKWYNDYLIGKAEPDDMPKVILEDDHTTMIVWHNGICRVFGTDMPYPDELQEPTAWGCGRDFAIGAMDAGCDAKRACEIAVARHALLGGPVQVIDLLQLQECAA